LEIAFPVELLL